MSQTFLDLTYRITKKYYQHLYLIYYKIYTPSGSIKQVVLDIDTVFKKRF